MMREVLIRLSRSQRMADLMTSNRLAWSAASRFVAGSTIQDAVRAVCTYRQQGWLAALDYLGEGVTSADEARRTADEYVAAIGVLESAGVVDGTYVSLKLTALGLDVADGLAEAQLRRVVERAAATTPAMLVRVDMEGSPYTQRTLDIFHRVFADHRNTGIVVQAMLHRTDDDVERLVEVGAPVRLCKGAYAEPPSIAYPEKADVDEAYRRQAARLISPEAFAAGARLAAATHDERIIDWLKDHAAQRGVGRESFEFQMLNGVRRDLWTRLVAEGYRMRVYVPYGTHWYPYFMRRLAERPENVAFMARSILAELRP